MAPENPRSDERLLLAVSAGDTSAWSEFKARHAALLERICGSVTPDARTRAEACRDLVESRDFAAIFAGFDPRAGWRTFASAAVVNRFLFPRLLGRLARDAAGHAGEFEGFFRREIVRAVRTTVPRRDLDEDAAQWIWGRLLEDDCRLLRDFAADARTPGFVAFKLKLLARDFLNSSAAPAEGRKRALPDALADLPAFDQEVFKQFYWWRAATAAIALLALRQRHPDATEADVRDARVRVEAVLRARGGGLVVDRQAVSLDAAAEDGHRTVPQVASPEAPSSFAEIERAAFRRAVLEAARGLSDREKLCLLKRLQGKAAGEIARELRIPNPEAYELMRRVVDKLRRALSTHPAARERIATVTGNDTYLEPDRTPGAAAAPGTRGRRGADR